MYVCLAVTLVKRLNRLGYYFSKRWSIYQNKAKAYSCFDILLGFKIAFLIVTPLHSLPNGSIFLSHDIKKTEHLIKNLMTHYRKFIKLSYTKVHFYLSSQ